MANIFLKYIQTLGICAIAVVLFLMFIDSKGRGVSQVQIEEITAELKSIHALLSARAPNAVYPPVNRAANPVAIPAANVALPVMGQDATVELNLSTDDEFLGDAKTPYVLIEYTDYQCPFCRKFHLDSFPGIDNDFIRTGKLRYLSRDFPLGFHEHAQDAAVAAKCAKNQHQYWAYRHFLFAKPSAFTRNDLLNYAKELALDEASFARCLDDQNQRASIKRDRDEAIGIGVNGTPTLVLGKIEGGLFKGIKMAGVPAYGMLKTKLNGLVNAN